MNYLANNKYTIKYLTNNDEIKELNFTPKVDTNKPQLIMKLKQRDDNFFKLIENKGDESLMENFVKVDDVDTTIKSIKNESFKAIRENKYTLIEDVDNNDNK